MRDIMLIIHFIGLTLGIGAGVAGVFMSLITTKLPKEDAIKVNQTNLSLIFLAKTGLVILIVSGFALMTPYWSVFKSLAPWFHLKLTLVFILLINMVFMVIFANKAKKQEGLAYLPKVKWLGRFSVLLGFMIIISAVKTFH
jgi:uncharacterized membrane protein